MGRTIVVLTGTIVLTLSGGPSALTFSGSGGDGDTDSLTRASAVALAATGGGRVTDTEVGDDESLYEVEVTLDDGRKVDVQLDETFTVVADSADVEEPEGATGDWRVSRSAAVQDRGGSSTSYGTDTAGWSP